MFYLHWNQIMLLVMLCTFEKSFADTDVIHKKRKSKCKCQYECTNVHKEMNIVMHCLKTCGFCIIPNLYNPATLNQIYIKFFHNFTDAERYQYLDRKCEQNGECLYGKRFEHAIPHFITIDGFEQIIYQPLIAESALNFMKQEMKQRGGVNVYDFDKNPIILDTMTFITAPRNTIDISQQFHQDGLFGIKLQIPLINITKNRGPIELFALEGLHIDRDVQKIKQNNCRVKGIVTLGSAIIYQQNLFHRGTKNNHNNIRPVIDTSFLTLQEHIAQAYFESFTHIAQNDMAKNQQMFYEYCDKSVNCPGTQTTYCKKEENRSARDRRAKGKARAKARAAARSRARTRSRNIMFGY